MFNSSLKKVITFVFTVSIIMTLAYGIVAYGAANLTLDKQNYLSGEDMNIKVSGLTDQQINDQRPWVGIFKKDAKSTAEIVYTEVSSLDTTNTWSVKAPNELNNYEARLYASVDGKDVLICSTSFIVESRKAKDGDVTISKTTLSVNEEVTVTIKGLLDSQLDNRAWVGIFVAGDPNDKNISWKYVNDLDGTSSRTWTFNAPTDFGNYEVRVFTGDATGDKALQTLLYDSKPFTVGSTVAGAGDVAINKDFFLVNEKITVTVKSSKESPTGLTDEQLADRAWIALYKADDDVNKSDYIQWVYVNSLGRSPYQWTFTAPKDFGKYKVVIFTKDLDKNKRSTAQYNTTPLSFSVGSLPGKEGDVTLSKTEFLVGDKATLAFKPDALTTEQIDDGAWFGVFYNTDQIGAQPLTEDYVSVIRNKNFTTDFEVPSTLGSYELRVYTKGSTDKDILTQAKFYTIPFKVVSKTSKDKNDVRTDNGNQKYKMGEAINVIIKTYGSQKDSEMATKNGNAGELTPGQISHGAWAGLFKLGDSNDAQPILTVSLSDNNTIRRKTSDGSLIWNFQAPTTPGEYIIKVFTQSTDADKRDPVFFAELPITVLNAVKVTVSQSSFNWSDYTLQVTPNPVNTTVGGKTTLNVVAKPKRGAGTATPTTVNNLVNFSSKDPKIAKVTINSLGKAVITGIKKGTTTIYITAKNNSSYGTSIVVTVK